MGHINISLGRKVPHIPMMSEPARLIRAKQHLTISIRLLEFSYSKLFLTKGCIIKACLTHCSERAFLF